MSAFRTAWKVAATVSTVYTIYKQIQNLKELAEAAQNLNLYDTSGFTNPLSSVVLNPQTATQAQQVKAGA